MQIKHDILSTDTFLTVHQYTAINLINIMSWNDSYRPMAQTLEIHKSKLVGIWKPKTK